MQAQINAPLQALLQTAAMVTPDKQNPTVAAKVAQAAEQKVGAAPPGIEALLPGVRQQAMMSAQAAQPATQGDVNQLRQMMARAAPSQGIAPGVDVQMAEGGIVGYDGRTGSEVEIDETKLPVGERFKRRLRSLYEAIETDFMKRAGATPEMIAQKLGKEPSVPVSPLVSPEQVPPSEAFARPRTDIVQQAPAPSPRPPLGERKQPAASTSTPASSFATEPIYPVEAAMTKPSAADARFYELQNLINTYGEQRKQKPEATPEEAAYKRATEAQYQRGIGAINEARDRFNATQLEQRKKDLINYLSGIGGAGSLFRGMARSGQALSQVQDQREAAKIAYFDKLDERRNAVENLNLAVLQQDAERARAWSQEVRRIDDERNKLLIGLGEKRMAEEAQAEREREKTTSQANLTREEIAARAKENELNRKAQRELEEYRRKTQLMKPRELEEIHRIEALKLNELTGGKPGTATPQQKLEAIQFAHESVKGAGRAEGVQARNRAEAYKRYAEWEKGPGETIRAMNMKNPKVFEDAARAKKREIYESLGLEIPGMGGGSGQEPPPNIKAILNKYGS